MENYAYTASIRAFIDGERQKDLTEVMCQIFTNEKDKDLFFDRHIKNIREDQLAIEYNTKVNNIKYRLSRTKKRLKERYNKLYKSERF